MIVAAIDTNVLIYAAQRDGDRAKHEAAAGLLRRLSVAGRAVVPLQALAEFYAVAVRKGQVALGDAAAFVDVVTEMFPVREAALADAIDAMRVHREHGVPFWDGMLWSVARRAGARILLSEDFQDGRELEGVRFVNPFAKANVALLRDVVGDDRAT